MSGIDQTVKRLSRARKQYLRENPFDPNKNAIMGHDADGMPAGFITLPDMGELGILGCKLGMEYLAICRDEDAVEEWISTCLGLAKSPELAGILFANVFRGMNTLIGTILVDRGLADQMVSIAVEAWEKDFGSDFGAGAR